MKYITLKQIKAHSPCADQFRKVRRFFGKRTRIAVTVKAAVAVADRFDFNWLAFWVLTPTARAEYGRLAEAALAEYERVRAPAWAEYERGRAPAQAEYERVKAAAFARAYQRMR